MDPMRTLVELSLVVALSCLPATDTLAQLVLEVDPTHETVSITGADTGRGEYSAMAGYSIASWYPGFPPSGGVEDVIVTTGLTISGGPIDVAVLRVWGNGAILLEVVITGDPPDPVTISGTGTRFSYASFESSRKTVLENAIGSSLILDTGHGFASVSILHDPGPSPIPALGPLGLTLMLVLIGCAAWRGLGVPAQG